MVNDRRGGFRGRGGRSRNENEDARPPKRKVLADPKVQSMFEGYQTELDGKHDKMERITKLSRDTIIESKRIIFQLHRITTTEDKADLLSKSFDRLNQVREKLFELIAIELLNEDPYYYLYKYNWALQEYIEACAFFWFLKEERLVSFSEIGLGLVFPESEEKLQRRVTVTLVDYLLGIGDLGGELMRFAINSVSAGDFEAPKRVMMFLRAIHEGFCLLGHSVPGRDFSQKARVHRQSLMKVENAVYILHLRTTELRGDALVNAKQLLADAVCASNQAISFGDEEEGSYSKESY